MVKSNLPLIVSLASLSQSFADQGAPSLPPGFHNDLDDISVSAGHFHTCAIESRPGGEFGGGIKCWGENAHGQATAPSGIFVQVRFGAREVCEKRDVTGGVRSWRSQAEPPRQPLFTGDIPTQSTESGRKRD